MKKHVILFVAVLLITALSCKKNHDYPPNPSHPSPPVNSEIDDARTVLLKDVVLVSLPSPYYHFEYDDQHYVKLIDYASGLYIYNVEYENKRVTKMTNTRGSNFFIYSYANNQVSEINEFSGPAQNKVRSYRFLYNNDNQLTQILWYEFVTNNNGVIYKKSVLTYHADGNLAGIDHYSTGTGTGTGQLALSKKDRFSDYDNKTNVDDFYLVRDFFDATFFLPQVKMQKNNPLKQQIFTDLVDYDITYTYDYQNTLPVKRTGTMRETRGANAGKTIQIFNFYTYY